MNNNYQTMAEITSYVTPLNYVSGRIVEYDIASANITMLYKAGAITKSYYDYLSFLPKHDREVLVGMMIRKNRDIYNIIKNGIIESKRKLFEMNNISFDTVVRIANDAVYINSPIDLQYTCFGNVIFKKKSISCSMTRLGNLLLFFSYNSDNINLEVKGMSKENQVLHQDYMFTFIAQVINIIERYNIEDALNEIGLFYKEYVNLELPKEYYRELSADSYYKIKNSQFYVSDIDSVEDIDINYNLYIIRELWAIILEKYNVSIGRI